MTYPYGVYSGSENGKICMCFLSIGSNYVQDYQAASNKNVVQISAHELLE